jgi:hypothetical protein
MTTNRNVLIQIKGKTMNWITILGILIIAVGTLTTYYGSSLSSNKDKKEITDKLDNFNQNIEKIKSENIPPQEKTEKINKIKSEFDAWAEQFMNNKDEKKVAIEKNEVIISEQKIQLNNQWRPLYVKFFTSLNKMVTSYNRVNAESNILLLENPALPNNIYKAKSDKFKVIVQFNTKVYWIIYLRVREPIDKILIPSIEILYSDKTGTSLLSSGDLTLEPYPDQNKIFVETYSIFDKAGFKNTYDLDPNFDQITELLKKAFEYQVLLAEN